MLYAYMTYNELMHYYLPWGPCWGYQILLNLRECKVSFT